MLPGTPLTWASGIPLGAADRPPVEPATEVSTPPEGSSQAFPLAIPDAVDVLLMHRRSHRLVHLSRIANHASSLRLCDAQLIAPSTGCSTANSGIFR